jgi:phosphoribosylanthranilate isomerase
MLVKFCGFTRTADAEWAGRCGISMTGFVHCPDSPRHVDAARMRDLADAAGSSVKKVGVFARCGLDAVRRIAETGFLDYVQVYDDDIFETLRANQACIKACRPRSVEEMRALQTPAAPHLLLADSYHLRLAGGTGVQLESRLLDAAPCLSQIIVAAGLMLKLCPAFLRDTRHWALIFHQVLKARRASRVLKR